MKSVLIDANLLVLLLLGAANPSLVGRHKKLKRYVPEQFHQLRELVGCIPRHVSTPHVLAETSNLINAGQREPAPNVTKFFAEYCMKVDELIFDASKAAVSPLLFQLGLTDTVILERVVPDGVVIVTDDYELSGRVQSLGGNALNIWHGLTP